KNAIRGGSRQPKTVPPPPGDVAAVVGCEKHHGLRDLIRCAEPPERNTVGNGLYDLLGPFLGMPWGRDGSPDPRLDVRAARPPLNHSFFENAGCSRLIHIGSFLGLRNIHREQLHCVSSFVTNNSHDQIVFGRGSSVPSSYVSTFSFRKPTRPRIFAHSIVG